jgi:Na+/phosphate symporter
VDARTLDPAVQQDDVVAMGDEVVRAFLCVRNAFVRLEPAPLDEAVRFTRRVQEQEQALIHRMVRPAGGDSSVPDEEAVFVPMHLERIADNIELLGAVIGRMIRDGTLFTERANGEVRRLSSAVLELLEGLRDALRTGNRTLVRYVQDAGRACEAQANEFALFHEARLIEGVCQPRASSVYLALLDHLRGIEWHARQVAEKLGATRLTESFD